MKIAVLLSGGVDSSVALRLLKDEGYNLVAFYLKIWLQDEYSFLGDCPWEEDLKYAKEICSQADVPLEILPLQNEYWDTVVRYTLDEVKEGLKIITIEKVEDAIPYVFPAVKKKKTSSKANKKETKKKK